MRSAIQDLKALQIAQAEQAAGISITSLEDPDAPKTMLLIALGWQVAKKLNPSLTFQEYGLSKTLEEVTDELGLVDDEDE